MSKKILCIKNGNPYMSDTIRYFKDQGFLVYELDTFAADPLHQLIKDLDEKGEMLDILVMGADESVPADGDIFKAHDDVYMAEHLSEQLNGMRNAVFDLLPNLRRGEGKRIALITSESSSVSYNTATTNYVQQMTLAGMNMVGMTFFHLLRPEGFTFRWFCASEEKGGLTAGEYILLDFSYNAGEPYIHSEENHLVMRDGYFRQIPF